MTWIDLGTLIAAVIAAGAAVWAAFISQRQFTHALRANDPPQPVVEATIRPFLSGKDEWTAVDLVLRNQAALTLDLLSARMTRPRKVKCLSYEQATLDTVDEFNNPSLRHPLPAQEARSEIALTGQLAPAGTRGSVGPWDVLRTEFFAHLPLARFVEEGRPSLILEMRWRDQTTKTFEMTVNIIKPKTM